MATAVNVLQWGHFARRRDTSGAYLQGLGVEIDPGGHAHADPLAQPGRASQALGVDTQCDLARAAGVERVEGLAEQRLAEAAAAMVSPGAEDVHPADPEVVDRAERGGRKLVAGANKEAQVVDDLLGHQPLLVGARAMVPMVEEGALENLVEVA